MDLILILSKVESFGNVTFEAGISNCSIIINQQVTGADIAKSLGFDVHTYNNFDASEICETIENVKIIKKNKTQRDLNKKELNHLVHKVING